MKRYLAGAVFGLVLGLVGLSQANVPGLPLFSGPIDPGTQASNLNQLVNSINSQITSYINFSTATAELGEMQISGNGNTWAANGTAATTMTSLGPQGAHTTVQEWLVVFDTNGFLRFIPAY